MIERRARASIELVGSLWYTCWLDAGQPDLGNIKYEPKKEEDEKEKNFFQTLIEKSKMIGRRDE